MNLYFNMASFQNEKAVQTETDEECFRERGVQQTS